MFHLESCLLINSCSGLLVVNLLVLKERSLQNNLYAISNKNRVDTIV